MQTLMIKAYTDKDGVMRLEIPTDMRDRELEIVLVMNPLDAEPVDDMGYPIGYFDETYGSLADNPIERDQPAQSDVRDELL